MTSVAKSDLMTVAALPWISPGFNSVYKPEISVVHSNRRQVPSLVAVLTENGRMAALAGLFIRLGKNRVFGRPVKIVILGLYINHVNMAHVALARSYIACLGVEMAKMTSLLTRKE